MSTVHGPGPSLMTFFEGLTPGACAQRDILASLAHPAVDLATGERLNAPQAFAKDRLAAATTRRPDHALRSAVLELQEPRTALLSPESFTENLKKFAMDAITGEPFVHPTLAADGFTYSLSSIQQALRAQAEAGRDLTSPTTNEKMRDLTLIANTDMLALMRRAGLEHCHSADPDYTVTLPVAAPKPKRPGGPWTLQLDYLRDAPAALAVSDACISSLTETLRSDACAEGLPLGRLKIMVAGLRAQAQTGVLFVAPKYRHVTSITKKLRAIDVQLQLGHVRKAEKLVRNGLSATPSHAILLSRMALIAAVRRDDTAVFAHLGTLFGCAPDAALEQLLERTLHSTQDHQRSVWPLLATAGLMLERTHQQVEGANLLHTAADFFPSRLLNGYRASC